MVHCLVEAECELVAGVHGESAGATAGGAADVASEVVR